jgi:ribosomal protein S18 acetylase RimI-like enzyme
MSSLQIEPVADGERAEACRWLFADEQRAARCLDMLAFGEFDASGLFVARRTGLCGAMLVQLLGGGLGLAWPPRAGSVEFEDSLALVALMWLRSRGVKACQAFADVDEVPAFAPLLRHGFRHVTQLIHMRREIGPLPPAESRLTFTLADREHFARTLRATYTDSLDCRELNVVRAESDSPDFARAFVAWHGAEAVGVLGLDDAELAYLGLIPSARGRGFGDELLRFAIETSEDAAVSLSVDARNGPALRLYARHGFVEVARREAFLAVWDGS